MKEVILCYQGEMALKGLNKATFEASLAKAVRFRLRDLGEFKVYKAQSTLYIEPETEDADMDEAFRRVSRVFREASDPRDRRDRLDRPVLRGLPVRRDPLVSLERRVRKVRRASRVRKERRDPPVSLERRV